ncbi:uncharacterized protein [Branchiostoma lanceolatum]|uniref:uncharacterized protein n=1 Tax=Branchiostoma lanceolatum TaxID=7740 RepID=UPI003454BEC4
MEVVDLTDADPDCSRDDIQKNDEIHSECSDSESTDGTQVSSLMEVWDGSPESGPSSCSGESATSSVDRLHGCKAKPSGVAQMYQTVKESSCTEVKLEPDKDGDTQQVTGSYSKERSLRKHASPDPSMKKGEYEHNSCKSGVLEIIDLTEEEEDKEPSASEDTAQRLINKTGDKINSPTSSEAVRSSTEQCCVTTAGPCLVDLTNCNSVQADVVAGISSVRQETVSNVVSVSETEDPSLSKTGKGKDSKTCGGGKENLVNKDEDLAAPETDLDDEVAAILDKDKSPDPSMQNPDNADTVNAFSAQCERDSQGGKAHPGSGLSEELMDKVENYKKTGVVQSLLSLRVETTSVLDSPDTESTEEQSTRVQPTVPTDEEYEHHLLEQEVALVLASICVRIKDTEPTRLVEEGSLVSPKDATQKNEDTQSDLEVQNHTVGQQEDTLGHHSLLSHVDAGIDESTGMEIMELYEDSAVAFEAHSPVKDTSTIPRSSTSPKKLSCDTQPTALGTLALCKVSQVENTEDDQVEMQSIPSSCSETESSSTNQVQNNEEVLDKEEVEESQGQDQNVNLQERLVPNVNDAKPEKENGPEEIENQKSSEEELQQDDQRNVCMEKQNEGQANIYEEQRKKDVKCSQDLSPAIDKIIDDTEESAKTASCNSVEETTTRVNGHGQSPLQQKQDALPLEKNAENADEVEQIDNSGSSSLNSPFCKDIDFSQLDLSPNSSIGDAILDFVQQAHVNIQESFHPVVNMVIVKAMGNKNVKTA